MKEVSIISKVVGRKVDSTNIPASSGAVVDMYAYLLKAIWDSIFEIKKTDDGEEYLFCKKYFVTNYGITMYANDESLDIPDLFDGIPIDGSTIYWEETTNEDGSVTRVLKAKGGGSGTGGSIEHALTWSGFSTGTYDGKSAQNIEIPNNTNQLTNGAGFITSSALSGYATETWVTNKGYITSSALNGYATETWVGENFLPITGGQLQGDLRLRAGSEYYGRTLYFGDGSYAYISEDSDDHMLIYGNKGVDIEMGTSYYLEVTGKGIKLNGGILTYNSSSGYWELEGDLLVNGDITMI